MKKILILSYHFPPMNVIASQRAYGYANHFKKFGYEPTILTFNWNKSFEEMQCEMQDFDAQVIHEKQDDYNVIRIPVLKSGWLRFVKKQEGNFSYKLWIIISWLIGKLDVNPQILMHAKSESHYLKRYVKQGDYDLVMGVCSPHFHLKHCSELNKQTGIPYLLDFRDLWSNRILNKNYQPSFRFKLQDRMVAKYWRKWSQKAVALTITSKPWAKKLQEVTGAKVEVVTNGFEPQEIAVKEKRKTGDGILNVVHLGSVYHQQKMDILLEGVKRALATNPDLNLKIHFIGALREGENSKFSFNSRLDKMFANQLPERNYSITRRVDRAEALQWLVDADVLLFPAFPDTPGTYSGKIFEYLMAKKDILMFPSDHGVCEELLTETQAGVVCNTPDEMANYLSEKCRELKENGELVFEGNELVNQYSRERQCGVLASIINQHVKS